MTIRTYEQNDREQVVAMWQNSGITRPWNDPNRDIDRKMAVDPSGFIVAVDEGVVVGTVMAGYEGHRGWVQYLAVEPTRQCEGIGRALTLAAIEILRSRGCPKVNLQVRRSNQSVVALYESMGFVEDDVLSMGLRLEADE